MLVKPGVDISAARPEIRRIWAVIEEMYPKRGMGEFLLTSTNESAPGRLVNSLHYANLAFDINKYLYVSSPPIMLDELQDKIKEKHGNAYDIVEGHGYFHIEYDPKEK